MRKILKASFRHIFLFLFLLHFTAISRAQNPEKGASPGKSPMSEARELMSTNKNAQALEVLQKQGAVTIPRHLKEQDSIVKSIAGKFAKEKGKMIQEITEKESRVKELMSENDDIDEENTILTTNTIIFFSALTGAVVFILLGRYRVLARSREKLNNASRLRAEMEKEAAAVHALNASLSDLRKPLILAGNHLTNATPVLAAIIADKNHQLHKQAKQLVSSTDAAIQMIDSRLAPADDVKTETDLNLLIEEVVNQAYFSMVDQYPEFKCTVVKDLEKILPKLEVYPEEIRFVLFNLLENAFDAVWKKRSNSPKGYVPTVTISSRKLPRFVQIRVKDNGIGIPEKAAKKVFEPFYSDRDSAQHAGLGLPESHRIITQKHKGELFIESDLVSSTDFIIRFPTLALM